MHLLSDSNISENILNKIGKKAGNLNKLLNAGFVVPDGARELAKIESKKGKPGMHAYIP